LGSGFFASDGIVATNLHVIEGAAKAYVKLVGKETMYDVDGIVGLDRDNDLVLLEVRGTKAPPLLLGNAHQVAVGDQVYVVGNPEGLEGTLSQGLVSGIRRLDSKTLFQISAPISHGSSGGPVLNSEGKVIGVAVAILEGGQNLNFAVPISYLGTTLSNLTPVRPLFTQNRRGILLRDQQIDLRQRRPGRVGTNRAGQH
jgi:S1-C subfamily serine protease